MSIAVTCRACGKRFKAPESMAGRRVRCKCGDAIRIAPVDAAPEPDALDLGALAAGDVMNAATCPDCHSAMEEDAVLCVQCGYNRKTGHKVGAKFDDPPSPPDAAAQPKPARRDRATSGGLAVGGIIKAACIVLMIAGLGWGAYHIAAAITFDPTAQLEADMQKVSPKMTVYEVVEAMGRPPKEILTERDPATSDSVVRFVPKKLFWSADFLDKYSPEDLQYGFRFIYKYSEREELVLWFDTSGALTSVNKHDPFAPLWR